MARNTVKDFKAYIGSIEGDLAQTIYRFEYFLDNTYNEKHRAIHNDPKLSNKLKQFFDFGEKLKAFKKDFSDKMNSDDGDSLYHTFEIESTLIISPNERMRREVLETGVLMANRSFEQNVIGTLLRKRDFVNPKYDMPIEASSSLNILDQGRSLESVLRYIEVDGPAYPDAHMVWSSGYVTLNTRSNVRNPISETISRANSQINREIRDYRKQVSRFIEMVKINEVDPREQLDKIQGFLEHIVAMIDDKNQHSTLYVMYMNDKKLATSTDKINWHIASSGISMPITNLEELAGVEDYISPEFFG